MDGMNAPATADVAQASGTPDSGGELNSLEDIAAALERHDEQDSVSEPDSEAEAAEEGTVSPAQPEATDAPGTDAPDAEAAEETPSQAQPEAPEVMAPASWKPEEKALFASLPPDVRAALSRRETEREQFVNLKAQEAATERQERMKLEGAMRQNLGPALQAAQLAYEADFSGIDWQGLQRENPAAYQELSAQRAERLQRIETVRQQVQALGQQDAQRRQAAMQEHLQTEFTAMQPAIADLMGQADYDRTAYRNDMSAYMKAQGAPDGHINGMTHGYQLVLATKAMLYDKQQQARKAAAEKVASAPKVQPPKARNQQHNQGPDVNAAKERIRKGGSSTENIADALKLAGF